MEKVTSHADFILKAGRLDKTFLLLYKTGGEQSLCALQHMKQAFEGMTDVAFYFADVAEVRDIHPVYSITSVPSLLVFEKDMLTSVIKGCHDSSFYRSMAENAVFSAKAQTGEKTPRNVTVFSTPTCSWCNTLKTWLRRNNIPFTDMDVSSNQTAADEMVRRSGQQGVPQTEINGQIVIGFDQKKLKELLEIA